MIRRRPAGIALAAWLLASSCTTEPVVTTITVTPASTSLDAIGETEQLAATVTAQDGRPLPSVAVTWASNNAAATVSAAGLVTAVANGTAQITATANGASGSATITVSQQVDALAKTGGDAQTGEVGTALATPLSVRANDRLGNPVPGVNVVFSVSAGGGSVATGVVTTPSTGTASTSFTLGRVAGAAQTVVASAQGKTASFGATATRGPADSLVKFSGDNQFAPASTAVTESLVVRIADRFGNPVSGHAVTFATSNGASVSPANATTGANGRAAARFTLGTTGGISYTATATASGVTTGSPATFTATALSGTVTILEGNNQTGLVGFGVNVPPAIRVRDQSNMGIQGLTVTFALTGGNGALTGANAVTDVDGIARVGKWTLGLAAGTNTMTATITGTGFSGNPAQFSATGTTGAYNIVLRDLTGMSPAQQTAFDNAKVRWQQLVFGDVTDALVNQSVEFCSTGAGTMNETVDDLVIFVRVEAIDGPGNVLGSAGPCLVRTGSSLPVVGQMRFDSADLVNLENSGRLGDVILHEMGHVLGIGTLWNTFGFLKNPSLPSSTGADTHFDGPKAIAAFNDVGGTAYVAGSKVPVENATGGQGTQDAHWRETVFDEELMTGFIEAQGVANPLSRVTIASLWDFGYAVNLDGADAYAYPAPALAGRRDGRQLLLNDIATGPIYVLGPDGRAARVLRY